MINKIQMYVKRQGFKMIKTVKMIKRKRMQEFAIFTTIRNQMVPGSTLIRVTIT